MLAIVAINLAAPVFAQPASDAAPGGTPSSPSSTPSGSGGTPERPGTEAPSIPEIGTLPGPGSGSVSQVSPYITQNLLPRIARTITGLAITLAVIALIFGSIQFLTAYGDETKLTNAKKTFTFAMIGLVISLLAFAIVQLIFFTGFQVAQIT